MKTTFYKFTFILGCAILLVSEIISGAVRTSTQNGNWNSTSTWGGLSVPVANDNVFINHTVTYSSFIAGLNRNGTGSITINAGGTFVYSSGFLFTNGGSGSITINAGGALSYSGLSGFTQSGTGSITINAGSTFSYGGSGSFTQSGSGTITVGGQLTCSGFGSFTHTAGSVVINNAGTLLMSGIGNYDFSSAGNFTVQSGGLFSFTGFGGFNHTGTGAANVNAGGTFWGSTITYTFSGTGSTNIFGTMTLGYSYYHSGSGTTNINNTGLLIVHTQTGVNFTQDLYMGVGSAVTMTGGQIQVQNYNAAWLALAGADISILSGGAKNFTGGTIQIGNAATTSTTWPYEVRIDPLIYNFTVWGTNAPVARLETSTLSAKNDITVKAGGKLDAAANSINIDIGGTWDNSGIFLPGTATVKFNGSVVPQFMKGSTSTTFNNLTINSTTDVTLQTDESVSGVLALVWGKVFTTTNYLTMNVASSNFSNNPNHNSFIYGPMKKIGNSAYTFPVGKDAESRPISISLLSGFETFTAEYFHVDPAPVYNVASKDPTLSNISRCEYWTLERAGGAVANVTLSWDTYSCGVNDPSKLIVAKWDGSTWKDQGNSAFTPLAVQGKVSSLGTIGSFITPVNPFTLSSTDEVLNPLPVTLLSFNAVYNGSTVDVNWSTASEINSDVFIVEKSMERNNFTEVSEIKSTGNSTVQIDYHTEDDFPYAGVSYYRLKQVDVDGKYEYSPLTAVNVNEAGELLYIYADHTKNGLAYIFNSNENSYRAEIVDMSGNVIVSNQQLFSNSGLIDLSGVSSGVYIARIITEKSVITKKFFY